jgi:hypothetical protein
VKLILNKSTLRAEGGQEAKKAKRAKKAKKSFCPFCPFLPFLLPHSVPMKEADIVNAPGHQCFCAIK